GPLTEIFRMSLAMGLVSKDWRVAHVVPLFKKGSKCKPGNYRPVSLTSVVGKLMESVLRDGIYKYLEVQGLLGSNQHDFVRGRSCLTNLIEFFEGVTKKVDEGKAVDVVYLDFSKAFDKVPHRRLGKKVEALGINEEVVKWIQQWLDGRCQRVVQALPSCDVEFVESEYGWTSTRTCNVCPTHVVTLWTSQLTSLPCDQKVEANFFLSTDGEEVLDLRGSPALRHGHHDRLLHEIMDRKRWTDIAVNAWEIGCTLGSSTLCHFGRSSKQ
ncbi:uncharacterized protein, partial [Narcine bancroftii]|uniref:uncharacterized protein n=1 Tax=Narcine bancroftii TaxID=1343680 RepID=UPI0038321C89